MQNLEAFRDAAELTLKVSLRIDPESVTGVSNSCDLARSVCMYARVLRDVQCAMCNV